MTVDINEHMKLHGKDATLQHLDAAKEERKRVLQTLTEFLADFVPPDYLLDGILQRRFIYALTGQTGHGKTAIALLLARLVGGSNPDDAALGSHRVEKGHVVYFAGENPDDLKMRIIGDDILHADTMARISFIPGRFSISEMHQKIEAETKQLGGIDLVIIDTSATYFKGSDELNNTEMAAHARMLRDLTRLPGGPCVVALCHPIKHVTEPSQLLPRGGGAFLAEIDGNLTIWKQDGLLRLHHSDKFRGPGFDSINLRLETVKTTRLMDKKGRIIPTVRAVWLSEADSEREAEYARTDRDTLLQVMLKNPNKSYSALAEACNWFYYSRDAAGEMTTLPAKSKVQRNLDQLKKDGLVEISVGVATLTKRGTTQAKMVAERTKVSEADIVDLASRRGQDFDDDL
jgi:hypothetical protein